MIEPRSTARSFSLVVLVLSAALACNRPAPEPPAPQRVGNPTLGIALSAVPLPFRVESNSPDGLVLVADEGTRVDFQDADPSAGADVVAAAKASQDDFAAKPGGKFEGGTQLVTPYGSSYTVRGSFDDGGSRIEERRVYMPHPDGSGRLLVVRYRYPAGDLAAARERLQQMIALVSNLELETAVDNAN